MLFVYELSGPSPALEPVRALLPEARIGWLALAVAALLGLALAVRLPRDARAMAWAARLVPALALAGSYVFFLRWIDEVFINLEHPWNLFHFHRFSFSPERMVDGTVEMVYYGLLTPFARTHHGLVLANAVLAGVLALGHLAVVGRLFREQTPAFRLLAGVVFAAWWPLACIFANGFGTALVSLVFLYSAVAFIAGESRRHLWLAALLPLIRIDGVAYAGAIFFADLVVHRRLRWAAWLATAAALGVTLGCFRVCYGHWVPTPVSFKSFTREMFSLLRFGDLLRLTDYFQVSLHLLSVAAAMLGFFFFRSARLVRALWLALPLGCLFVFYSLTSWNPILDGRYYFGWELLLMLLPLLVLAETRPAELPPAAALRYVRLAALVLLANAAWLAADRKSLHKYTSDLGDHWTPWTTLRVDGFTAGAQILAPLVPREWTLSATELNSFGYMLDRPVIDLWGYTNRDIALSHEISGRRIRHNPRLFLELKPDIHWHRTGAEDPEGWMADYGRFETVCLAQSNFGPEHDQFGPMAEVLRFYDAMILRTGEWRTIVLVKRERRSALEARLQAAGYRLAQSRALDPRLLP